MQAISLLPAKNEGYIAMLEWPSFIIVMLTLNLKQLLAFLECDLRHCAAFLFTYVKHDYVVFVEEFHRSKVTTVPYLNPCNHAVDWV